jgi:rare lipoprotein A
MRRLLFIFVLLSVVGCNFGVPLGQRASEPAGSMEKSKYGNPKSYVVLGKRYYVMDSAAGFRQRGVASWYGPDFHGKSTSSGESYNMHAMTAAHKTLPIPVMVRVKNLDNGKTAVVKVNDRGPFAHGRIIDLSFAAAKKLGVVGPGTANVEITALDASGQASSAPAVRATPLAQSDADDSELFIQLGSFGDKANARKLRDELAAKNEKPIVIRTVETDKGAFFRVQLGPLLDVAEATSIQLRLKRKGYNNARIVIN